MLRNVITQRMAKDIYAVIETTNRSIQSIADEFNVSLPHVRELYETHYDEAFKNARKRRCYRQSKLGIKNPMFGLCGELHPRYIGDVSDGKGYLMRVKPDWYTGRRGCKHVFVHHIVMCQALGLTEMPKGMVVHHIDGDPTNNDLSNLQMMTPSAHTRLHQLERATTIRKE